MLNRNEELIKQMGFIKIDKIEEIDINFELNKNYESSPIIILNDGVVIHDIYNRQVFNVKKQLDLQNVYYINKDEFDKTKTFIIEKDFNNIDLGETYERKEDSIDDSEILKLLHSIIGAAVRGNVSDIHILPKNEKTLIKFRDTGDLKIHKELPYSYSNLLVNKLKSKGDMDITNKMSPQDGKARFVLDGKNIEVRINTLPTVFGENAVLRVQQSDGLFDRKLDDLGFFPEDLEKYRKSFNEPYGMILNVGATGAGKTTTFYLTISELVQKYEGSKNIVTVEDPVEIRFPEITQVEVEDAQNRSFATVLRALMRQDPDIILLGEIRDSETGGIAVKASLTGHLVLATLHANDSFNAITRLRDLGISDTLISSTLNCVISQRLAKKLCPHCKKEGTVSQTIVEKYMLESNKVFESVGCPKCNNTGYKGRLAIVEVLTFDEEFKVSISNSMSEIELKKIARNKGFSNLWKNGVKKVHLGETSLEQLALVVNKDSILNNNSKEESKKMLDIRKVFYPNKQIEVNFGSFKGVLFDISSRGISVLFENSKFLNIDKQYNVKVGNHEIDFIAKSYGEIETAEGSKFLVGGMYIGELDYMTLGDEK